MILVSDASPLITLSAIGRLGVLRVLYETVLIPQAVYDEVVVRGAGEPGAREVRDAPWLQVEVAPTPPGWTGALDRGEAEAIALAKQWSADWLLMDERRGRRLAEQHGLRVIGTLGVLVEATRQGEIPNLADDLSAIRTNGFYLDDTLVEYALNAARLSR